MKGYRRRILMVLTVLALAAAPAAGLAGPFDRLPFDRLPFDRLPADRVPFTYSKLVVFGDSLSDVGNVSIATDGQLPGPFYYPGTFSNGPNLTGHLADALGLVNDPFLAGGTNLAWAGARTSGHEFSGVDQLARYLAAAAADPPPPDALFLVYLGGNNLRDTLVAAAQDPAHAPSIIEYDTALAVADMAHIIGSLAAAGARHIAVPNQPNLGRVPAVTQTGDPTAVFLATGLTQYYNWALEQVLAGLDPLVDIRRVDVFGLFERIAADPAAFGLVNVTDPCFSGNPGDTTGTVCANPDTYVFWDGLHPTTVGHMILADGIFEAVLPGPRPRGIGRGR